MSLRYNAKPLHLYTYCAPMLVLGAIGMGWGIVVLFWLGLLLFLFAIGMGCWIVYAGILQARSEYIENLAYNGKVISQSAITMTKVKDPNVWAALGYTMPTPIEEPRVVREELPGVQLPKLSFPVPPATLPQMQLFANAVLRGDRMSENRWGGKGKPFTAPQIVNLLRWMEHPDRKYIRFVNPTYPKLGRVATRSGTLFLLTYADLEVQQLYSKQGDIREGEKIGPGRSPAGKELPPLPS